MGKSGLGLYVVSLLRWLVMEGSTANDYRFVSQTVASQTLIGCLVDFLALQVAQKHHQVAGPPPKSARPESLCSSLGPLVAMKRLAKAAMQGIGQCLEQLVTISYVQQSSNQMGNVIFTVFFITPCAENLFVYPAIAHPTARLFTDPQQQMLPMAT